MKRIISIMLCIVTALAVLAACAKMPQTGKQEQAPGSPPVVLQHWVTKELANDGLKKYTGDLELYLNDDGSAFIRFRDYNVEDYHSNSDEYQTDDNGDLYNEYGLYYTWKESFGLVTFEPMDANDYYLTENNQVHYNDVKQETRRFYISKGKIKSDGTMEMTFGFASTYDQGHREKNEVNFILQQTDDLSGAETLTSQSEAEGEKAAIEQAIKDTDAFCRAFISGSPEQISQFRSYNNYEDVAGSFWFGLRNASVLYADGVLFAVVDVALYPQYAQNGSAVFDRGEDEDTGPVSIEVLRNENNSYALLYEPNKKPSNAILECFASLPEGVAKQYDGGAGKFQDFYYSFGSGFSDVPFTNYELMSLGMVDDDSAAALLYIREGDYVLDGYPIEVSADKVEELGRIIEEYGIGDWNEEYELEPEDMVVDGYGYFVATQYDNAYRSSSGYEAFPANYDQAHDALVAFFEEMREQKTESDIPDQKQKMTDDVTSINLLTFSYGSYVDDDGRTEYNIYSTEQGWELCFGSIDEPKATALLSRETEREIIEIYKKHDVFSWDGYDVNKGGSDYVFLNDIYLDSQGKSFNFSVHGVGQEPEGWQAFCDELTAYLNGVLGI